MNTQLRTDSPDYMNIEYFKQQKINTVSNIVSKEQNQLMQKLDLDFEQQEKIYQSVLSKNARLEIENLKNEVAKQRQLKEKLNQSLKEDNSGKVNDESKLSNDLEQDIMPPPLNLEARSIKRRDSERSARLAQIEKNKLEKRSNDDENDDKADTDTNTDVTDDNSDEINLSPNPFTRSQFRRSFMNAVYTQKPHNVAASYHASHAYCGPIDDNAIECLDDDNLRNSNNNSINNQNSDQETSLKQLTMQQRRDQLQRLLHSESSIKTDVDNFDNGSSFKDIGQQHIISNQQNRLPAIKPPRNTFKLTKDCLIQSDSVRATPAIIVATPEKETSSIEEERLNESIHKQINDNINQVNQVKKQLAFDLIEPVVSHKPPRGQNYSKNLRKNETTIQKTVESEKLMKIIDRTKLLEQNLSDQNSAISSSNSSLKEETDKNLIEEPVNLTNRFRSCSLTLCETDQTNEGQKQRLRSLSGQNLNYSNNEDSSNNQIDQTNHQIKTILEQSDQTTENLNDLEVKTTDENIQQKNDNQQSNQNLNETKLVENEQNLNQDKVNEDDGYLTMESKLNSNNEIDDQQLFLSPSGEQDSNSESNILEKKNEEIKKSTQDIIPQNINFDEVFGVNTAKQETAAAISPTSSTDADDEQSLKSQINQLEPSNQSLFKINNCLPADEEDDNRKTVDDQFAIYSGLNTIKKAPANYSRKTNDFKLTSALTDQKSNYKHNNQLSHQFIQYASSQQIITQTSSSEQSNDLNFMQPTQSQLILAEQHQPYRPQQIVASSLINRSNNLVFVSNPVISPEMMDANPAYESFDSLKYGQSCLPACDTKENFDKQNIQNAETKETESAQKEMINDDDNDNVNSIESKNSIKCELKEDEQKNKLERIVLQPTSTGQTNAPYYYSDLLPENQNENENLPISSNRCNNSRNIEVTSLQKLSINKKSNSSSESADKKSDEKTENKIDQTEQKSEKSSKIINLNNEQASEKVETTTNEQNEEQVNPTVSPAIIQNISNSMNELCEEDMEMYNAMNDDDPVYENVYRFTSSRSQSSINLNNSVAVQNNLDNETHSTSYTNLVDQSTSKEQDHDDYLNENVLRRVSHSYLQKAKIKSIEKLNNQEQEEQTECNDSRTTTASLNNQTPTKLNNSIKNALNHHRTTPIHLRSPTVTGYATMDSEQTVLINDDYKVQQTADINTNNINNINNQTNKLSWKSNLISQSASNLNSNRVKPNNLNYNGSTTSSLSSSSAQSLNQLTRSEIPANELNSYNQHLQTINYRQQSAPNLSINNNLTSNGLSSLNNYHGNNLNNNTEKCLANKQLNLNKNINKINNLLNVATNGQDYVVYENAEVEREHLLALQRQIQQQQELLLQQQQQLQMLQQRQQQMKQQNYIHNEISSFDSNDQLPCYSNSSLPNNVSLLNDSTIPYDHHLKNLENVPILQKNNKNYHNYQNVFQDDQT